MRQKSKYGHSPRCHHPRTPEASERLLWPSRPETMTPHKPPSLIYGWAHPEFDSVSACRGEDARRHLISSPWFLFTKKHCNPRTSLCWEIFLYKLGSPVTPSWVVDRSSCSHSPRTNASRVGDWDLPRSSSCRKEVIWVPYVIFSTGATLMDLCFETGLTGLCWNSSIICHPCLCRTSEMLSGKHWQTFNHDVQTLQKQQRHFICGAALSLCCWQLIGHSGESLSDRRAPLFQKHKVHLFWDKHSQVYIQSSC